MDLQAILAQELRANQNLAPRHEGCLCLDYLIIKREIDQIEIFLTLLPAGQ